MGNLTYYLLSCYLLIVTPTTSNHPESEQHWRPCAVRGFGGKVAPVTAWCKISGVAQSGCSVPPVRRGYVPWFRARVFRGRTKAHLRRTASPRRRSAASQLRSVCVLALARGRGRAASLCVVPVSHLNLLRPLRRFGRRALHSAQCFDAGAAQRVVRLGYLFGTAFCGRF